jgi:hypothetical protein
METKTRYHKYSRWEKGTGHTVEINKTDLDYLMALFTHGDLSTAMLHQLVRPHSKQDNTTNRLRDLKRDPRDLIIQPKQQRAGYNANYKPLVYRLSLKGLDLLLARGRITREHVDLYMRLRQNYHHFHHDYVTSYLTASIEIGTRAQAETRFIPWHEILTSEKCPIDTQEALNPLHIIYKPHNDKKRERAIVPDALLGVEIQGKKQYFVLETDCATEAIQSTSIDNSSILGKLHAYCEIYKEQMYKTHFGISNMRVLIVTTMHTHLVGMTKRIEALAKENKIAGTRPFLFQSVPYMAKEENKPIPTGHLFTVPYKRVRFPDVYINILDQ